MLISAYAGSSRQNKYVVIFLFNDSYILGIAILVYICHEFYLHLRQFSNGLENAHVQFINSFHINI